jgi:hypothetical protein
MTYLGGSVAALATDRNAWHSRADQAWGSSRTWNSGSSFEAELSAMTSDRDIWHSRADNAWGSSRTWASGESWEQAYNRVMPASDTLLSNTQAHNTTGAATGLQQLTLNRSGIWDISIVLSGTYVQNAQGGPFLRVHVTGLASQDYQQRHDCSAEDVNGEFSFGFHVSGQYSSGQSIALQLDSWLLTLNSTGVISAHFVPTPAYPH